MDKLSVEEAKARLATIHSQQKDAAAEIKVMREDIMNKMTTVAGEAKEKLSEILTKAGTISQKLDAEMQAAVKARSVGLDLHRGLGPKLRPPTPVLRIQGRHRRRVQRGDGCRGGLDRVGPVSIAVGDQSGEELELLC